MIAMGNTVRGKVLGLTVAGVTSTVFAMLGLAGHSQNSVQTSDAASIFQSRCVSCHGGDGAGTTLGKSMQIPDLRSTQIQEQPDSALAQVIREGKSNMPSFASSVASTQIEGLVGYIRQLSQCT